jgi:hypothetical protein
MKLRRSVLLTATLGLLFALTPITGASATTGPYCDPGWTEVAPIFVTSPQGKLPAPYAGSLCRYPGTQYLNVRLNFTDMRSSGSYTLDYYEEYIPGAPRITDTSTGTFTPSSTLVGSKMSVPQMYGAVRAGVRVDGTFQGTQTITENTPVTVTTPKSSAQKAAAKNVRDKSIKKAKKAYAKAAKKTKSAKSARSKKAKKVYTKAVTAAQAKYRKAVAPTSTTINRTTTKQVPGPLMYWSGTAKYNV